MAYTELEQINTTILKIYNEAIRSLICKILITVVLTYSYLDILTSLNSGSCIDATNAFRY